ncbi:dihydroorotate dehydrogenase electron transfer subunit [Jeotgalibacillus sp. R-1-5s-1]|uniref:dihydroorotate dehydrogenase electron transfer subunit n=1 Tax=Jeotgalibacillus sp. R-1-5s-1 TaxID=2555897 RepID=UPI00106D7CF3|nr:dihydroorotate dehydrogenase electron transfer subunit [Jeotgalibacillus sp. R-1-5s-1]TFE03554.1 dihydroorotate dehydrogenase electron transfer subunit [Jeotgalibacillus sp. R-1-5s-1]
MIREQMKVLGNKKLAHQIYEMTLSGELVSLIRTPGQFVHIRTSSGNDPLLRRPISISSYNQEENTMTVIYRASGLGTKQMAESPYDTIDVLGPLGSGYQVNEDVKGKSMLLIGGGIGVPPLYELSKQLVEKGASVTHVLGFESARVVFYEKEFSELGQTLIATADGSHGCKGFVTNVIEQQGLIHADAFYACGPVPMLAAVEEQLAHIPGFVSMEQRMGCGVGACLACVCEVKDPDVPYKKVCTDGPVFRKGELIYG